MSKKKSVAPVLVAEGKFRSMLDRLLKTKPLKRKEIVKTKAKRSRVIERLT